MKEIIPILVDLVFTIMTVIVIPYVIKLLKKKMSDEQIKDLYTVVKWAVYAFEQMITELNQGPVKKEQVINFVKKYCLEHKIPVDDEILEVLIESIVKEMNDNKLLIENEEHKNESKRKKSVRIC